MPTTHKPVFMSDGYHCDHRSSPTLHVVSLQNRNHIYHFHQMHLYIFLDIWCDCSIYKYVYIYMYIHVAYGFVCPLQWRHNDQDGVSNHQPHGCLLKPLFKRRSKKTSKLRVTGLCVGNSPGLVNSPHEGPVTRKMFPFDDVIMRSW